MRFVFLPWRTSPVISPQLRNIYRTSQSSDRIVQPHETSHSPGVRTVTRSSVGTNMSETMEKRSDCFIKGPPSLTCCRVLATESWDCQQSDVDTKWSEGFDPVVNSFSNSYHNIDTTNGRCSRYKSVTFPLDRTRIIVWIWSK